MVVLLARLIYRGAAVTLILIGLSTEIAVFQHALLFPSTRYMILVLRNNLSIGK